MKANANPGPVDRADLHGVQHQAHRGIYADIDREKALLPGRRSASDVFSGAEQVYMGG